MHTREAELPFALATARPEVPTVSLVTPAWNEARNLPLLYERICSTFDLNGTRDWEWVIVDDHSADETMKVASEIAGRDSRVSCVRLARNCGSHAASLCGIRLAHGASAAILASDLQDPPELIPQMLERWRAGAQIVWAAREERKGEKASTLAASRVYYWLMRNVIGLPQIAPEGADFVLIDRTVRDALELFPELNTDLFSLLAWMGFRQETIGYVKQTRLHGASGWSTAKKIKAAIDAVTCFSYLPIRIMSTAGCVLAVCGVIHGGMIVFNAFTGHPVQGWSSIMLAILLIGAIQCLMMGVLGEYLWRALDEARRRPRFLIEERTRR